jgi:glycosyltransferase involved in cell wall biosynthesis
VHRSDALEQIRAWYGNTRSPPIRQLPFAGHRHDPMEESPAGSHLEPVISSPNSEALRLSAADHWELVAALYRDTLEELYAISPRAREQNLVASIVRVPAEREPTDANLVAVAKSMALNREPFGLPQLLVDVTILAKYDARTGIQRVTRAILMALIADQPAGYRIEPVRAVADGYLYARRFSSRCLGLPEDYLTDDPVEPEPGDIFIGLDWGADIVPPVKPWFLARRRHGTQIIFVAYDLLPVARPEFFPPEMSALANEWVKTVADVADGVICISRAVADEFCQWLGKELPRRLQPLSLGYFHLGADLHASLPTTGLSSDASAILAKLRSRPSFLMVGTVEPRKGHRQALAAMEQLWTKGLDLNLVIIGKQGWMTDRLEERIRQHPEYGRRLFWLEGVSDEMLEQVYRASHALLVPSEGEGFGLPLIEAAQYGLPIIARDIPVFREVAGEHAFYFTGGDPQSLADSLRTWISLGDAVPVSSTIPRLTWQQSSRQLLDVILGKRWYRSWPDTEPRNDGATGQALSAANPPAPGACSLANQPTN